MILSENTLVMYHDLLGMNMFQNQMDTAFMVSPTNLIYYDESTNHGVSIIDYGDYIKVHYMVDCYFINNVNPVQLGGTIVGSLDVHRVIGLTQQVRTETRVFQPEKDPLYWSALVMMIVTSKPEFMVNFNQSLIRTIPNLIMESIKGDGDE